MNYSDQELVQKTLDGDADSFSILVQRYQKQIYSLTYRLTNDPEDARDLAQEVFIHIFQVLASMTRTASSSPGCIKWPQTFAIMPCAEERRNRR